MKATREERRIIDRLRRKFGKRNGVIPNCFLDHPKLIGDCTRREAAKAPEVSSNANKLSLVHVIHPKNAEDTWVTSSELKGMLESGWVVAGPVRSKTT